MAVASGLPHSAALRAAAEVIVTSNALKVRAFTGTPLILSRARAQFPQLDTGCVTFPEVWSQRMGRAAGVADRYVNHRRR